MQVSRIDSFIRRRGLDLAMCAAVLGWVVACAKKNQPTAAPTPAPQALAAESSPASSNAEPSKPTATAEMSCPPSADFQDRLRRAASPSDRARLGEQLTAEGHGSPSEALTHWLVLAHRQQEKCASFREDGTDARDLLFDAPAVTESMIDAAIAQQHCPFLIGVQSLEMWPYEVQFIVEINRRDFTAAETTRRLWHDTLEKVESICGTDLSRRQQVALQTKQSKLERIIGLDDEILIDLRSKMLDALESEKSDAVLAYSRAIMEREKALDQHNAAMYDAKLADIESELRAERERNKVAANTVSGTTSASTSTTQAPAADPVEVTANIAKAAKDVHGTVKTVHRIGKMMGL